MQPLGFTVVYAFMKLRWPLLCLGFVAGSAVGQIQVELEFPRLQYIAHEPVVANLVITNLAGRDIDLRDMQNQPLVRFRGQRRRRAADRPDFEDRNRIVKRGCRPTCYPNNKPDALVRRPRFRDLPGPGPRLLSRPQQILLFVDQHFRGD